MNSRKILIIILAVQFLFACGGGGDQIEATGCNIFKFPSSKECLEPSTADGVGGDQASSSSDTSVSTGDDPSLVEFSKSGSGDSVFEIPPGVIAVQVTGKVSIGASSNFVIRFNDDIKVNEVIGNADSAIDEYNGKLRLQPSDIKTIVEITNSAGVAWSFDSVMIE